MSQPSPAVQRRRMTVAIILILALLAVAVVVVGAVSAGANGAAGAAASATPTPTETPRPAPAAAAPPATVDTFDRTAHSLDDPMSIWVVVNKLRPMNPQDFEPEDLVFVDVEHTFEPYMRQEASDAIVTMFDAAANEADLFLASNSAFRSYGAQENIYDGDDLLTARPGFSEHQTGLPMDIGASSGECSIEAVLRRAARGHLAARQRLPIRLHPAVSRRQDGGHRLRVGAVALPLRRRAARDRDARHGASPPSKSSSGSRRRRPMNERMPHRGLSLTILIVNQLLAGVGVASGIAVAALLVDELTGVVALAGLAQSASVLGAALAAIPLARLAVRAGRHVSLATGYACAFAGAVLVVAAAASGWVVLVFLGLAAFGAGAAAGLQARFAATEVAAPGFEARYMSLVLWATTLGSVAGPLLAETGAQVGAALGLPPLVGPFLLSGAVFAISSVLVATLLRLPKAGVLESDAVPAVAPAGVPDDAAPGVPDEAISAADRGAPDEGARVSTSAPAAPSSAPASPPAAVGSWSALRTAVREPRALFAVLAIVCSHTVMIGVMVMTPVHMTAHGLSLSLVGVVLSIHILGMYGASPIVGWLADRIGSARVISLGIGFLLTATLIGILMPADDVLLIPLALGLLGLGWSCGLIGGSTLLNHSVDASIRVPLQGATDASMNLAAAASAALSGVVLGIGGFAGVNMVAVLVLVPLVIAGLRARRAARAARAATPAAQS